MIERFFVALVLSASGPTIVAAQTEQGAASVTTDAELVAAIANARAARDDAARALLKAEQSEARLQQLRTELAAPERSQAVAAAAKSPTVPTIPADVNSGRNATAPVGCEGMPLTGKDLNDWVSECLKLTSPKDYKATDVAFATAVSKSDEVFEANLGRTFRYPYSFPALTGGQKTNGAETDGKTSRARYWKAQVGVFATEDDGVATLARFDEATSGSGIVVGLEHGWFRPQTKAEAGKQFNKAVETARQACVADKLVSKDGADLAEARAACAGTGLWNWIGTEKNGSTYWASTAGALYGADATPSWVVGVKGRFGWTSRKYLTPEILGTLDATSRFGDLDALQLEDETNPYSITLYGGGAITQVKNYLQDKNDDEDSWIEGLGVGWIASLGYVHDFEFASSVKEKTVCLPVKDEVYQSCGEFNLAPPVRIDEFVPGLAVHFNSPAVSILPQFGLSLEGTYSTRTDRLGIQIPVYFALSEGKLTGGIKYFHRSSGTGSSGEILEQEDGLVVFLGTTFDLLGGR